MDNPLSKIIEEGKKEFEEKFVYIPPAESIMGCDNLLRPYEVLGSVGSIKSHIKSRELGLLQGFLTEIGSDETTKHCVGNFTRSCIVDAVNQERTRLRKVVEGAVNKLTDNK